MAVVTVRHSEAVEGGGGRTTEGNDRTAGERGVCRCSSRAVKQFPRARTKAFYGEYIRYADDMPDPWNTSFGVTLADGNLNTAHYVSFSMARQRSPEASR